MAPAIDEMWEELTFLAYHLHWGLDDLLDLEHADRLRLLAQVGSLNDRAWQEIRHA